MTLPRRAKVLGYAGLAPQAAFLAAVVGGAWGWTALALAYAYAAIILTFVGGVWWGIALTREDAPDWVLPVAVLPSLIALAGWFPWTVGWAWPQPELFVLGLCLLASPFVDKAIPVRPAGWLKLRSHLSFGLGGMTILIALFG